ncbi:MULTISPECIES: type IV pilus twitching motility protein PilT [Moraxella]|uniref:Twitching motility protein PilT n=1 Tax=Moraxella catarrhalis TaxID=480 RepID=A0A7Z0UXL8_MORCA|nr:type IV pilus twitching motility protein PilT [Moraxella catarrhalis]OAV00128.1 Twitching motility protein PilT [Moraxella catarrhalis]STY81203.1 Twitching mobility protein [Moraxella catarrhalis]
MLNLKDLLVFAHNQGASDLHLSAQQPVMLRIDGNLLPMDITPIDTDSIMQMLRLVMDDTDYRQWQHNLEHDFVLSLDGIARFRVNVFFQAHGAAAVFRVIQAKVPTLRRLIDDDRIYDSLRQITTLRAGLVLVTGATGSGKSTTLASFIDHINQHQKKHIITIEDPIEYEHVSKLSLINQRQVGKDTRSFQNALRSALREDPDVILVGELRDLETIRLALTAAETGHLVLATLHTVNAPKSIDRIIEVFDAAEKHMIRTMLADSLKAVIAQRLLPAQGGGRVAAFEILTHTPAVANLIRENKISQLPSVIQTSSAQGMISLSHHLSRLVSSGKISPDTANHHAQERLF